MWGGGEVQANQAGGRWNAWNSILDSAGPPARPAPSAPPPPASDLSTATRPAGVRALFRLQQLQQLSLPPAWRVLAPLAGGAVIAMALAIIQPPFVTGTAQTTYEARRLCLTKLAGWTTVAVLLMYALPLVRA